MSTVCRPFAQACANLLARPEVSISLANASQPKKKMLLSGSISPLLMSWAPHVYHLRLDHYLFSVPNHEAFLAQAHQLRELTLVSWIRGSRAALGHSLNRFLHEQPTITMLTCGRTIVPISFPAALQELQVGLRSSGEAETLLNHLFKSGMQLRVLSLSIRHFSIPASQACLPLLDKLKICTHLSKGTPDRPNHPAQLRVGWLQQQPYKHLEFTCIVEGRDLRDPQPLAELQSLGVHHFYLQLMSGFWESLQRAWQPIGNCSTSSLHIEDKEPIMLHVLPRCPQLDIRLRLRSRNPIAIHWAALASQARCVSMHFDEQGIGREISVQGFPGCLPFDDVGRPWQFIIYGQGDVYGLPGTQQCSEATYMLQNKAAAAAGWTDVPKRPFCRRVPYW